MEYFNGVFSVYDGTTEQSNVWWSDTRHIYTGRVLCRVSSQHAVSELQFRKMSHRRIHTWMDKFCNGGSYERGLPLSGFLSKGSSDIGLSHYHEVSNGNIILLFFQRLCDSLLGCNGSCALSHLIFVCENLHASVHMLRTRYCSIHV